MKKIFTKKNIPKAAKNEDQRETVRKAEPILRVYNGIARFDGNVFFTNKKEYKGWAVVVEDKLIDVYTSESEMWFMLELNLITKEQLKKVTIIIEE